MTSSMKSYIVAMCVWTFIRPWTPFNKFYKRPSNIDERALKRRSNRGLKIGFVSKLLLAWTFHRPGKVFGTIWVPIWFQSTGVEVRECSLEEWLLPICLHDLTCMHFRSVLSLYTNRAYGRTALGTLWKYFGKISVALSKLKQFHFT